MTFFVTSYVDFNKSTKNYIDKSFIKSKLKIGKYLEFLNKKIDHNFYIKILFSSIKKNHPNSRLYVLTDEETDFNLGDISGIKIIRFEVDSRKIMLSRMTMELMFLEENIKNKQNIVFLDFDILLNKNIDFIFSRGFDIGLTFRDTKEMLINGGVILVNGLAISRGVNFFKRMLELYKLNYSDQDVWWGDQFVLQNMLDKKNGFRDFNIIKNSEGTNIILLDANRYNFIPRKISEWLNMDQKYLIHFTSVKKRLMPISFKMISSENFFLKLFFKIILIINLWRIKIINFIRIIE